MYVVLSSANCVVFSTDVSQNNINLKYLERNEQVRLRAMDWC